MAGSISERASGGLAVERPAQVLQTAVDLHGGDPAAGPEAAGDLQRGGDVGAVDGPDSRPSTRAACRAIANASAVGTAITSSKSSGRSIGGQRPMPPPSMRCVPGDPPESTADSPGSTTTRWRSGRADAIARVVPRKEPAVPTYEQHASRAVELLDQFPAERPYPSIMSVLLNWSVQNAPVSAAISPARRIIAGTSSGVDAIGARDQLDLGPEGAHRPDLLDRERVGRHDP